MQHTLAQAGETSATQAWHRYADLDEWSRWAPFITSVEARERVLATGLTGTVVGVGGLRIAFEVLAVDAPARTWRWRGGAPRRWRTSTSGWLVPWSRRCPRPWPRWSGVRSGSGGR